MLPQKTNTDSQAQGEVMRQSASGASPKPMYREQSASKAKLKVGLEKGRVMEELWVSCG
jgi:hypothetical protein